MKHVLRMLLPAVVAFGSVAAFNCAIPPYYIDIHNRAVHGTDQFQYGSFIGVGSPAQNQSLIPSLTRNETSVADINFCKNSNLTNCQGSTKGFFDIRDSSSWREDPKYQPADIDPLIVEKGFYGRDTIHLYHHFFESDAPTEMLVPDASVQVVVNGSESPGIVGLGPGSTLLQQMYNNGQIAGRTYGLYVGSGMQRAGGVINGSLTLGGYDASRMEGPVYNYTMDTTSENHFMVQVMDIILHESDGLLNNISLMDADRFPNLKNTSGPTPSFQAEITTDVWPFSFPYEVTQNFISTLAASRTDMPDGSLRLKDQFKGTMTIVLSDGFSVTLPSEVVSNLSSISPVADRDPKSTAPFQLSLAWLSQVYLMVDLDAYQFHLAQAVPEAEFISTKTYCPKTVPIPYTGPSGQTFSSKGMTGAIVGGVVGGLGFIALVVTLIVLLLRRRIAKKMEERDAKPWLIKDKGNNGFDFELEVEDGSAGALPEGKGRKKRFFSFTRS